MWQVATGASHVSWETSMANQKAIATACFEQRHTATTRRANSINTPPGAGLRGPHQAGPSRPVGSIGIGRSGGDHESNSSRGSWFRPRVSGLDSYRSEKRRVGGSAAPKSPECASASRPSNGARPISACSAVAKLSAASAKTAAWPVGEAMDENATLWLPLRP